MNRKALLILVCFLHVSDLTSLKTPKDPEIFVGRRRNTQPRIFPRECGVSHVQRRRETMATVLKSGGRGRPKRVVGGTESMQGEWPWQVALLYKGGQYCGGSLVNQHWVVTASHCFNPYSSSDPKDWTVIIGDHHLENKEPFEQIRKVKNITVHPRYKSMWFEGIYDTPPKFDVAVLKLEKSVSFADNIQPVCLYRPDLNFHAGEECFVVGWGHTKWSGQKPERLNYAKVRLVSRKMCNFEKAYNGTIHGTAICAGFPGGGTDSCEYDSGGGLVCKRCGRYYLLGLVSWGHECARPWKFGVYANMVVLTSWVRETIGDLIAENVRREKELSVKVTTPTVDSVVTTLSQQEKKITPPTVDSVVTTLSQQEKKITTPTTDSVVTTLSQQEKKTATPTTDSVVTTLSQQEKKIT